MVLLIWLLRILAFGLNLCLFMIIKLLLSCVLVFSPLHTQSLDCASIIRKSYIQFSLAHLRTQIDIFSLFQFQVIAQVDQINKLL